MSAKGPYIRPKNWDDFQHYKNRRPPWIKLHRTLLDDYEYARLPVESKAIAPLLWLLASESDDGCLQAASEVLAFRLRVASDVIARGLPPLIEAGFFEVASGVLADCLQGARPETEGETEGEGESLPREDLPPRLKVTTGGLG